VDSEINSEEYGTGGVLIKRTLRSGRTVRSTGHVVVIGDVNPGAEIIAYGDVVVWGKLRGIVHAGANGDESANVCALDLAPTQLRIAGYISIPPSGKRRQPKPEMAHIVNGQIEAVAWL
jgi:septum site-determining protein MinC